MAYKAYAACTDEEKALVDSASWMDVDRACSEGLGIDRVVQRISEGSAWHVAWIDPIVERVDDKDTMLAAMKAGKWQLANDMLKAHPGDHDLLMAVSECGDGFHESFARVVAESGDVDAMCKLAASGMLPKAGAAYRSLHAALAEAGAAEGIEAPDTEPDYIAKKRAVEACDEVGHGLMKQALDIDGVGAGRRDAGGKSLRDLCEALVSFSDIMTGRMQKGGSWLPDEVTMQYENLVRNAPAYAELVGDAASAVKDAFGEDADEQLHEALDGIGRLLDAAADAMGKTRGQG